MMNPEGGAMPAGHQHGTASVQPAGATVQTAATVTTQQTTCPVMGNPIDPAVFVEYKGKKVYFCCRGCDKKFQEDPEKYLAQLPQFQEPALKTKTDTADPGHNH
jgi:YHS domain-containing protein